MVNGSSRAVATRPLIQRSNLLVARVTHASVLRDSGFWQRPHICQKKADIDWIRAKARNYPETSFEVED